MSLGKENISLNSLVSIQFGFFLFMILVKE